MIAVCILYMQTVTKNKSSVKNYTGRNSVTTYYNKSGRQSTISKSPTGPTLSEAEETELENNTPNKTMTPDDIQPSIKESFATGEEKVTSFIKNEDTLY